MHGELRGTLAVRHVQSRYVPAYYDLPEVLLRSGKVLAVAQEA